MTAIICFDLIPKSLEISNIFSTICGITLGVLIMVFCDNFVSFSVKRKNVKTNLLLKTGIVVGIGLSIHNFPEGLAIGSGFDSSLKLGYSLAIAILLHDIPEGISMSVPMKSGGMNKNKVLIYTILSGLTTGIGAFFGALIGNISEYMISLCLAIAGRCHALYCVSEN